MAKELDWRADPEPGNRSEKSLMITFVYRYRESQSSRGMSANTKAYGEVLAQSVRALHPPRNRSGPKKHRPDK